MSARRAIIGAARRCAMTALGPVERACLRRADPDALRAVFVLGPPRSGTTLLYELLATRFGFAYFTNLAHQLPNTPAAATRLGRRWIGGWSGRFESDYGHIAGWGAPNEGGWIWRRWIPEEDWLGSERAGSLPVEEIRRTLSSISASMGGPFLNKNVMHGVHLRLLDALFPGCAFIEIERDPVSVARSMLRAREESGDPAAWMSVKPRGWEAFAGEDPRLQVCAQGLLTRRDVETDIAAIGGHRRLRIEYESLCADPNGELDRARSFLETVGVEPVDRGRRFEAFTVRRASRDDTTRDLEAAFEEAAKRIASMEAPAAACEQRA